MNPVQESLLTTTIYSCSDDRLYLPYQIPEWAFSAIDEFMDEIPLRNSTLGNDKERWVFMLGNSFMGVLVTGHALEKSMQLKAIVNMMNESLNENNTGEYRALDVYRLFEWGRRVFESKG